MNNLLIEANVCREAYATEVDRLIFLGSSCIYPRDCPQSVKEEYLLTAPFEPTNRPNILDKIADIEMCWSYNRQYGTKWLAIMPTNLYGLDDSYELNSSRVLPALIRKMHEAKVSGASEAVLWSSGTPTQEFLYVDDLANALVFLTTLDKERYAIQIDRTQCPLINVVTGEDVSICELAGIIAEAVNYKCNFVQNKSKPDGTMRKVKDVSKIQCLLIRHGEVLTPFWLSLPRFPYFSIDLRQMGFKHNLAGSIGWRANTSLEEGINLTYTKFNEAQA